MMTLPQREPASVGQVTFNQVAEAASSIEDDGQRVCVEAVRDLLGTGSPHIIHKHLAAWRASKPPAEAPKADIPDSVAASLGNWARKFADEAGASTRDALADAELDLEALRDSSEQLETERDELLDQVAQLQADLAERIERIERLTAEVRDARNVATEALVGKAKDQLAIEGKDNQLADLRAQIERNVASQANESDARLTAQMELIGAVTARDNFAAEIKELQAKLDAALGERRGLSVVRNAPDSAKGGAKELAKDGGKDSEMDEDGDDDLDDDGDGAEDGAKGSAKDSVTAS